MVSIVNSTTKVPVWPRRRASAGYDGAGIKPPARRADVVRTGPVPVPVLAELGALPWAAGRAVRVGRVAAVAAGRVGGRVGGVATGGSGTSGNGGSSVVSGMAGGSGSGPGAVGVASGGGESATAVLLAGSVASVISGSDQMVSLAFGGGSRFCVGLLTIAPTAPKPATLNHVASVPMFNG